MRGKKDAMFRSLTATHAVGEDFLKDPGQSNHADDIGGSNAAYIATEDRSEPVGDQVQAWRSGDFVIPGGEVVVAVLLCLWNMEHFVLETESMRILLLPGNVREKTYEVGFRDILIHQTRPPGEWQAKQDVAAGY